MFSDMLKLAPLEQHFRIRNEQGLALFLRYLGPASETDSSKIVLYIHGATFPSALSIAHRFDGHSWRDYLNARGYHVWGLDFLGFGGSDRFPEMVQSPEGQPALGRAEIASRQIESAVRFIADYHKVNQISLITHSWGSMAAGIFAGRNPDSLHRIVFFAPIAARLQGSPAEAYPAWHLVSLKDQWERFVEDVPADEPPVLSQRHFEEWGQLYLDTDKESRTRSPASVKTPTGPVQEIAEAWAGKLAYDPALIRTPVAIIRGEWDHLVTDTDARWLFDALKHSPVKRDIKISRGTHLLHLEKYRYALYREAWLFLEGEDAASIPATEQAPTDHSLTQATEGNIMKSTASTNRTSTQDIPIPGYGYGSPETAHSPVSIEEMHQLEEAVGWSEEDARILQQYGSIFRDHAEEMVDSWRKVIGEQPHLVKWFFGPDGKRDEQYAASIKKRFVQWVTDVCFRPHDQAWLDYQEEIGLRHTPQKKNKTDHRQTAPLVPMRYLVGFITVVTFSAREFFIKYGVKGNDLQKLHDAWAKGVQLHVTLWTRPYVQAGLW